MNLYIIRHGIAEPRDGLIPDEERALIPRGIKKVEQIAKKLTSVWVEPDTIFTSPYRRAFETAEIVVKYFQNKTSVISVSALEPGGSFDELIHNINEKAKVSCCIVGHEPHLSSFASYLLSDSGDIDIMLKKAGVCYISFSQGVQKGSGILEWLYQPAQLKM